MKKNLKDPKWYSLLVIGFGIVLIAHLLLQAFQNNLNFQVAIAFAFQWHWQLFLLSTLILFVVFIWLYSLIGHLILTSIVFLLSSLIIGWITLQKMSMRGEPLYPSDLEMINEISFLLKMTDPLMIVVLGLFGILVALGMLIWKREESNDHFMQFLNQHKKRRAILFILSTIMLLYVGQFNNQTNKVKAIYDQYAYWIPYSQDMNYYNNGIVAGFLYNLPGESIQEVSQYSKKNIEEIVHTYKKKADEMNQERTDSLEDMNIIFIMNESFADPFEFSTMSKYKDPIPYFRKITEETTSGHTLAPAYGGGTANSEFEALTGFSLEPLSPAISTPYTQLTKELDKLPSLAKVFKDKGMHATAIHPFNTTMYKRREVYEKLGFDEFIYDDRMTYTSRLSEEGFISDQAAYREVFHVMEQTEEKDFIHLVTMQNHTPYANKYDKKELIFDSRSNKKKIEGYFQDLHHSDLALKQLIEMVGNYQEDIAIVFWGDHLPSLYEEKVKSSMIQEELYKTPYFVFSSNREAELTNNNKWISPQFLHLELLELTNQRVTPFQAFLTSLSDEVPAFEKGMYYEKNRNRFVEEKSLLNTEAQTILNELHAIQYDVIEGENYMHGLHFFE